MKNDNLNILLDLIKSQCYEFRDPPFKLSSGKFSNHYFDCRNLLSSPEGFYYAGQVLSDILLTRILENKTYPTDMNNYIPKCRLLPYETCYRTVDIQAVGGMAVGAISISNTIMTTLYQKNIDINSFYIRKIDKNHGKTGKVVGIVNKNDNVIIVDDVLTTGHSIKTAIESIQEERSTIVTGILVLIDRQEGGSEFIMDQFHIPVFSAYTMNDILVVKDKI